MGVRAFKCPHCSRATSSHNIYRHILKVHGKKGQPVDLRPNYLEEERDWMARCFGKDRSAVSVESRRITESKDRLVAAKECEEI